MVPLAFVGCGPAGKASAPVFYPPLPQRPRYQFLRALTSSDDVVPQPSAFKRFVLGADLTRKVYRINRPYGMAFWDGKLYVCDIGGKRGLILDFKERDVHTFGDRGIYRLRAPANVSASPEGEKYVADPRGGQILVLNRDDKPVRAITKPEGMRPLDAVWHDGELFVADQASNAVLVLDPADGRVLRRIGKEGVGAGEFKWPTNLTFGPDGHLYVTDMLNARVQKLDKQGNVLTIIGERGVRLGDMVRPKGIALDRAGRLYVADAAPQSVQIYDVPVSPKLTGGPRLTFSATNRTITRDSGSWIRDGFQQGQRIRVIGSGSNDGTYRIDAGGDAVTATVLTLAPSEKLTPEGPSKVTAVAVAARLLLTLGGAGPEPGDMSLPAKVLISYEGLEYFQEYASPDFKLEYLLFVSNQFDATKKINVYGFGAYTGAVPDGQGKSEGAAPTPKDAEEQTRAPTSGAPPKKASEKPQAPSPEGGEEQ